MLGNGPIVAQIPARGGSKRVKAKNLRYIAGKPLLAYAVEAAIKSGCFDEVYVNTDSPEIADLASELGAAAYIRPPELGGDAATGDDFTTDFIRAKNPKTVAMVSPVCPLVTPDDIRCAVAAYKKSDCDTLITAEETQMQVFLEGVAVNIDDSAQLAPSQDNRKVAILNWAVTIWDAKTFLSNMASFGFGYLGKNRLIFPMPRDRGVKISVEADFQLAEAMLLRRNDDASGVMPRYWERTRRW